VVRVTQSTPIILLMILAGVVISAFGANTAFFALGAAILMLGLANGSNAGQAVAETHAHMQSEGSVDVSIRQAMRRSTAQLVAFVVNATRGSPAASVIGVPELLSALTDISSFSSERITTYTLLLVFYMLVVSAVVALGNLWLRSPAQKQLQEGIDNA
jgi:polar amino acid transport system substrate-binding protein